ncbi:MAG: LTA synthase family protein [Thermodesulfobacteriota bacterium]
MASVSGYLILFASLYLPPAVLRALLLIEKESTLGLHDVHGFFSDMVVVLFLAAAVSWLSRLWRVGGVVLAVVWCVLNYGSYEHVKTLNSLPLLANAGYLADRTFLMGSVVSISRPLLLGVVLLLSGLTARLAFRKETAAFSGSVFLVLALVTAGLNVAWQKDHGILGWRQANFAYENLRWSSLRSAVKGRADSLPAAEFNGTPVLKLDNAGQNVLLVMLEGVSGAYLDHIAETHGIGSAIKMPRLNELAENNVAYSTFISNQRQTNRGEYAILCGDYPRFLAAEPAMSESVRTGAELTCLPGILKDAGYDTVYLQAAPLGFMMKDQFMPKAGFSKTYGDEWFKSPYKRSEWGVDDRAFFEQSLEMVRKLQSSGRPWFLTMLTVGTHHPYAVPRGYKSPYPEGSSGEAFSYLDRAVGSFFNSLEEEGLLKDTLVLLTSDESAGIGSGANDVSKMLSQSWGFLIAIPPTGERMRIDERFMQVDLAASTLDYLGLDKRAAAAFTGRSVFRSYEKGRDIFFSNIYLNTSGMVGPDGNMYLCEANYRACFKFRAGKAGLFLPGQWEVVRGEQAVALFEKMAGKRPLPTGDGTFDIKLVEKQSVTLLDSPFQRIFGGQQFTVPAGTRIDVDMKINILDGNGKVVIYHDLISQKDTHRRSESTHTCFLAQSLLLGAGDTLSLRYTYYSKKELKEMEARLIGRIAGDGDLKLRVVEAVMRLSPAETVTDSVPKNSVREASVNGLPAKMYVSWGK